MEPPVAFESVLEDYPVRLDQFNGPLDLLLHLIKTNEVNIYDIPIVLITEQYLEYLELMRDLNLEVAGEFLVLAATLIHIKSRSLLPRPASMEADSEEDPRDVLARRLLEHQQFKMAAGLLKERETLRSAQWTRPDERVAEIAGQPLEPELEVDLFSLLKAFQFVIQRAKNRLPLPLPKAQISIEDRVTQISKIISEREACGFEDLFDDVSSHSDLIVTFLALLEMIRLKLVRVFQIGSSGSIRVYKRAAIDEERVVSDT